MDTANSYPYPVKTLTILICADIPRSLHVISKFVSAKLLSDLNNIQFRLLYKRFEISYTHYWLKNPFIYPHPNPFISKT